MSNRVTSEIGSRRARENLVRILFQHLKKDQFDDRLQRRRHSYSQLRAAYIDLVHTIHPDKLAPFHDDEERTRRQECQQKFVELQTAWEQYHASVREVLRDNMRSRMSGDNKNDDDRTFGDDSSCAIDDANFTMFGVGCCLLTPPTSVIGVIRLWNRRAEVGSLLPLSPSVRKEKEKMVSTHSVN